jgi:hypothetical protein
MVYYVDNMVYIIWIEVFLKLIIILLNQKNLMDRRENGWTST